MGVILGNRLGGKGLEGSEKLRARPYLMTHKNHKLAGYLFRYFGVKLIIQVI